jgi:hypothetical protein
MNYHLEIRDPWGRRTAVFDEVPVLEAMHGGPDQGDWIRGVLPGEANQAAPGSSARLYVQGRCVCEGSIVRSTFERSDLTRRILDRRVSFHELVEFAAERPALADNAQVWRTFRNAPASEIVKCLINNARGRVHYTVAHGEYPDGAEREYAKFAARSTDANALAQGRIDEGQWAGPDRIDASSAFALDGNRIGGLVVDGIPWPELRLLMTGAEELERNNRAMARHPETTDWSDVRYASSRYALDAEAARAALQALIDEDGIDHVELNPHRGPDGAFDGRVDADGRYIGLVHGNGRCLNAGLVERAPVDVELLNDGLLLPPEMALKEFLSYSGRQADSISASAEVVGEFAAMGGLYESVAALAYLAGGFVWSVDERGRLGFQRGDAVDRVLFFDATRMGVRTGAADVRANELLMHGGDALGAPGTAAARESSVRRYGRRGVELKYFSLARPEDAARLLEGLLDDLAYPATLGAVRAYDVDPQWTRGELLELRGAALRDVHEPLPDAWGGRLANRRVGRIQALRYEAAGRRMTIEAELGPPLRAVRDPLAFIAGGQPAPEMVRALRLDDEEAGLDAGYHLDSASGAAH